MGYRRKVGHVRTDSRTGISWHKKALKGNLLSCLTTMYDKNVIGDVLFPEDIDRPEDYVFRLNFLKTGIVAKGNPQVLPLFSYCDYTDCFITKISFINISVKTGRQRFLLSGWG